MSFINQVNQLSHAAARVTGGTQAPMAADSTSNSNSTGSTQSGSTVPGSTPASVQSQFNTFLTLLTTELKNQDPSSPLDTNQFTSQLVQFSQLEQTLNTNSDLQTLISLQQQGAVGGALGYLGHTIEATGGNIVLNGTDDVKLNYTLASNASTVTINILNSSGQTVASIPGDTAAGQNSVSYNGSYPGQPTLAAGQYTYQVVATDSSGNAVKATAYTTGTVTGVDSSNGTVKLHLGNIVIPASTVVQVTS